MSATPTTERQTEIEGVIFRPLRTISDERGFFREVMRVDDPRTPTSPVAAAHYDLAEGKLFEQEATGAAYWYVPVGSLHITLEDKRPAATYDAIAEFDLDGTDDARLLILPAGIAVTARALQRTQLVVFSLQ